MAISIKTDFLGEWANKGYALFEDVGDVSVSLYFKGSYVTCFNQTKVTSKEVQAACQEDWESRMDEDKQLFEQLLSEPISSLNRTQLNFMVDYCQLRIANAYKASTYDELAIYHWVCLIVMYQSQIDIIQNDNGGYGE